MPSAKKGSTVTRDTDSAIVLLMEDHKEVKKLFAQFKKIKDEDDSEEEKATLVAEVCQKLLVHAQVEEEIFYPAVREAIAEEALMDEAAVEHAVAKDLIEQLLEMQPGDDLYDAKVVVLSEAIEHHVEEEEGTMFPQAKKAKALTEELGTQMLERKQELLAEMEAGSASKRNGKSKGSKSSTASKKSSADATVS